MSAEIGKKRKRPQKQHGRKRKISKVTEEDVVKAETILLDTNRQPESKEDFEKLVFQSPISSVAWLGYAAFHLSHKEIASARAVMERALKRIPFTEEQEIQNIWFSYVNLESMYGVSKTLDAIVKRFLVHCDKFQAYDHLIKAYQRSQQTEEATEMGQKVIKKFKNLPEAWISYGNLLYSLGKADEARGLLKRSAQCLGQPQQVSVTMQFGRTEFQHGFTREGMMLFEDLCAAHPTRTDIWSVYVDAVAKLGNDEQTRQLFERILSLNLPEKKIQFLLKKYEDFKNKTAQ